MTTKLEVKISKVENIKGQIWVKYESYGGLGCAHSDFKNAEVGDIYIIEIDDEKLMGGTKLISAKEK